LRQQLQTPYVDLYLIHTPQSIESYGGIEKLWREFEKIKEQGLAKSIGVSNFNEEQLAELLSIAKIKPAVNQIKYYAYNVDANKGLLELAKKHGIVIEAYSSLAPITQQPGKSSRLGKVPLTSSAQEAKPASSTSFSVQWFLTRRRRGW
jgi:diketogulonate reductase-like aldo/keto reductase